MATIYFTRDAYLMTGNEAGDRFATKKNREKQGVILHKEFVALKWIFIVFDIKVLRAKIKAPAKKNNLGALSRNLILQSL